MSLLRKGLLVSGGQVLGIVLNTFLNILFSRYLGPAGTGQTELFRSTQTIVITLFSLGIGSASVYFLNDLKADPVQIVTNTLKATLAICAVVGAVLTVAILRFHGYFGAVSAATALWFSCSVGLMLVMYALRWVLIARLEAKRLVMLEIGMRAAVLAAGGLAAFAGRLNAEAALVILGIGNAGSAVLVILFLRRYIRLSQRFDWGLFRSLLAYSLKLAAVNLLYVLSLNITIMLLRYLRPGDFAAVGLYARAVGIGSMVTMIPAAVGPLLYAKWSGLKGEARARQGEMALRMNLAFGMLSCIALLLWGEPIIGLLYGAAFVPANKAMQILAPSLALMTVFTVCDNMLAGDGRAAVTAYIMAGTLTVIAGVAWLSIPALGIRGTALAVLCGNAFTAAASLAVCRKYYGIRVRRCLLLQGGDLRFILNSLSCRAGARIPQRSQA